MAGGRLRPALCGLLAHAQLHTCPAYPPLHPRPRQGRGLSRAWQLHLVRSCAWGRTSVVPHASQSHPGGHTWAHSLRSHAHLPGVYSPARPGLHCLQEAAAHTGSIRVHVCVPSTWHCPGVPVPCVSTPGRKQEEGEGALCEAASDTWLLRTQATMALGRGSRWRVHWRSWRTLLGRATA